MWDKKYSDLMIENDKLQRKNDKLKAFIISLVVMVVLLFANFFTTLDEYYDLKIENEQLKSKLINKINRLGKENSKLRFENTNMKLEIQYQDQEELNKVIEHIDKTFYIENIPLSLNQQRYIHKLCDKYNLDYELVLGLIDLESNFKMDAVNHNTNGTIDAGLFQVNSGNWDWMEDELERKLNMYNFKDNVDSGMFILNHYKDDNIYRHLTNYNRGMAGARNYYEKYLTYKSKYAKVVLQRSEQYK